jgi:ribosomal protein S18 acetylase RimI-like enzyme
MAAKGADQSFCIRRAVPADADEICAVLSECDDLHIAALPAVFRPPDPPIRTREAISDLLTDERAALLVAEQEGQIAGAVLAYLREAEGPLLVPHRYVVVDVISVGAPYRRCGVGRALMEGIHDWAHEQGADRVLLNVWAFNRRAVAFYRRLGYRTILRRMERRLR